MSTTVSAQQPSTLINGGDVFSKDHFRDSVDQDLDSLCFWFEGRFSNQEQHQRDSTIDLKQLNIRRIWDTRTDGRWYEFGLYTPPDTIAPYQKVIIQIHRVEEGMIECTWYTGSEQAGTMKKQFGCEWYLQYTGGSFVGGTHGYACVLGPGMSYATTDIEIRNFGMKLWQRGFDMFQQQVWGPIQAPYLFVRVPIGSLE